ncbi:MAG TPA: bifunctional nuclease family protein [Spirochaetales bacterium]|nr:bifunctional nuclease family protein [Spirochaetales bacterium]
MGSNTFVQAEVWTVAQTDQGNVVLIRPKGSDLVVPIFIGQLETQAILIGLGKVEMPRPLTHDLILSMLTMLDASLVRIEIRDLRDRTFFANVVLRGVEGEVSIDARPSDAIALAVRTSAEVFVAEDIVEIAGVPVDMIRESPPDGTPGSEPGGSDTASEASGAPIIEDVSVLRQGSPDFERAVLSAELENAIEAEDYERAARIRDRLKELP